VNQPANGHTIKIFGILALYAWLAYIMLRYEVDEDELGPGKFKF